MSSANSLNFNNVSLNAFGSDKIEYTQTALTTKVTPQSSNMPYVNLQRFENQELFISGFMNLSFDDDLQILSYS